MPAIFSKFNSATVAIVEQESNSKPPYMRPGDPTAQTCVDWERACRKYANNKDIPANKVVKRTLDGIEDVRFIDWIELDRPYFEAMTLDEFMTVFRKTHLPAHWQDDTRIALSRMQQDSISFWDFQVAVQTTNALLKGTPYHLDEAKLRERIQSGMDQVLYSQATNAKCNEIADLREWLAKVKDLDDEKRFERQQNIKAFEACAAATRAASRAVNTSQNVTSSSVLNGPSRKVNTPVPVSTTFSKADYPPKLSEEEKTLLLKYDGCLKCRKPFVYHKGSDKVPGCNFPVGTNYKPVTFATITSTMPVNYKVAKVAAIVPVSTIAGPSSAGHPVAAVFPGNANPVDYAAPNISSVIGGSGDPDSSVSADSGIPAISAIIDNVDTSAALAMNVPADIFAPLSVPHMFWRATAAAAATPDDIPIPFDCLIDNGSHLVLIRNSLAEDLSLRRHKLPQPIETEVAMREGEKKVILKLYEYVKLRLYDSSGEYATKSVRAIIAPNLVSPVILGLPFLSHNSIVVDHAARTVIDKVLNFDLMNPSVRPPPVPPKRKLRDIFNEIKDDRTLMVAELNMVCAERKVLMRRKFEPVRSVDVVAAVRVRIETLAAQEHLDRMSDAVKDKYSKVFNPIPHVDELPTDVYCRITLKDATKTFTTRSYSSPRKYKEAWAVLIQQHLDAGRIRPSNSAHASPAFLVPKSDSAELPRWVNDYRQLNANTVLDAFPLPRVEDILADCAKGKIWSKMDMTNSFFQTRVHPDDIHLTAMTTPLGLYEWLAMPMGLKNSPPIHQRRMVAALRHLIGKICHVYLDDIVIWSDTVAEHTKHIDMVMKALAAAKLHLNPKKCKFFRLELDFLGHHISARGIEPNSSKVEKILNWPVPRSATDVRAYLGLVRYVSAFLPKLADHTIVLTPLTTKDAHKHFPPWTDEHQCAFESIKSLVVSSECLTVIDHEDPGNNKIFVTCDASDWRTGAVLSFGPTWETARPVAYDSMQLKAAEKNYPIHEKELLAIIRALKKWRTDLLGSPIYVYTDHKTLENFDTQKDLSRRQLRWQEFLSQYEINMIYIPGPDNTVADALSRLPEDTDEIPIPHESWLSPVAAVLSIATDQTVLDAIKCGYTVDDYCVKIAETSVPGTKFVNGLWYVGDRLLIPRVGDIRENLFRLAHDVLGHFGADKSYAVLRDAYYWPNMRRDLEKSYIPSCQDCQRNKSRTTKAPGPLHPLAVPDARGSSIAMDFIGPLKPDQGFDCILTITDRLGADIRIIPTQINISAEDLAVLFFDHWFCENGLPTEIISDRDKLFISQFWTALSALCGVKLKMSSAYHPQTDGSSERTNKTVNQSLRYHVDRSQKGWVRALPRIRFAMMNTVNASTGFSNFQLHLGRSPRLIPPIVPTQLPDTIRSAASTAESVITRVNTDVKEAQDNLFKAKLFQEHYANANRGSEFVYKVGDDVMLSTFNRRREYRLKGEKRSAKFFPRWDGPYKVIKAHPESSSYTLDLPRDRNSFPTYYSSELKLHVANDPALFPSRVHSRPGPVLTPNGLQEYEIARILDARPRGRGYQFLIRWKGYGPEADEWLPATLLEDCEALDRWYESGGHGPGNARYLPTGF